jgi:transcription antitermination factor NusG
MSEILNWYAVRTRSNCEKKVSAILTEKGIENYLPAFQEVHQWKDRKRLIELPVFPGYLFASIVDSREARLAILRIDGVVNILGQAERIEPVPDHEIQAVRQLLESRTHCYAHPLLREGAWVRVRHGALKGLEGLLLRVKNQTRLVLSITLLSQSVSTEMDASDVQFLRLPAGAQAPQAQAANENSSLPNQLASKCSNWMQPGWAAESENKGFGDSSTSL